MRIVAENAGKKFGKEWVFRGFNYEFLTGGKYAITGNNGSGKSTLLKCLSLCNPLNEGLVSHIGNDNEDLSEVSFRDIVWVAPYTEMIEELTVKEFFDFYVNFKPLKLDYERFIHKFGFEKIPDKKLSEFSSGMKQRLHLGLTLYAEASIVLLDEPTSNLDKENSVWYQSVLSEPYNDKIILISSNQPEEYDCCHSVIDMGEYKKFV